MCYIVRTVSKPLRMRSTMLEVGEVSDNFGKPGQNRRYQVTYNDTFSLDETSSLLVRKFCTVYTQFCLIGTAIFEH